MLEDVVVVQHLLDYHHHPFDLLLVHDFVHLEESIERVEKADALAVVFRHGDVAQLIDHVIQQEPILIAV